MIVNRYVDGVWRRSYDVPDAQAFVSRVVGVAAQPGDRFVHLSNNDQGLHHVKEWWTDLGLEYWYVWYDWRA